MSARMHPTEARRRRVRQYEGRSFGAKMQGPPPKREGPSSGERADAAVSAIVELFESGTMPERIAETVIRRHETDAPCATWSLGNQLLCMLAGTDDARGYRQWQECWRHVKKGSKAFYILAPIKRKRSETDAATGETRDAVFVSGFKAIPVFRYEDTEGAPLEEHDYAPASFPPLFSVAERFGLAVRYLPFVSNFRGYFSPGRERIVLATHDAVTFWHELAHAAHGRVLAAKGRALNSGQDARQEIVAETVAAALAHLYGFDGYVADSAKYVEHYAKGESAGRAVMKVLAEVQATLALILETAQADEMLAEAEERRAA